MPIDTKLKMAVNPVGYHNSILDRCAWNKIPPEEIGGKDWWLITYKGYVFAEMWVGKSGVIGLLYTVRTNPDKTKTDSAKIIHDKDMRVVEMALVGALFNGRT